MREIKFRAWYRGKMYRFVEHHSHPDGSSGVNCLGVDIAHMFSPGDEVELMQYTGLKDKTGKEIYESDIVRWDGGEYTVIFSEEEGAWILKDDRNDWECPSLYGVRSPAQSRIVVIGNIYENAERVKAQ